MLLANTTVADILVKNVSKAAVLRRHKFPNDFKVKKFAEFTKKLGIDIQVNRDVNISR
jgi:exoribonuclease R